MFGCFLNNILCISFPIQIIIPPEFQKLERFHTSYRLLTSADWGDDSLVFLKIHNHFITFLSVLFHLLIFRKPNYVTNSTLTVSNTMSRDMVGDINHFR